MFSAHCRPVQRALLLAVLLWRGSDCADDGQSCDGGTCPADGGSGAQFPRLPASQRKESVPVWSSETIALHNGSDPSLPLLLVIVGEVYDVGGDGEKFYGPGSGYHGFAGKDASRAFGSNEFDSDKLSRIDDLDAEEFKSIMGWRDFYREHETYRFVGILEGRYFSAGGKPTAELEKLEAINTASVKVDEIKKQWRKQYKSCNSRSEGKNPFFEIWCDDGYHGKNTSPMHLYLTIPDKGGVAEDVSWCACLTRAQRKTISAEALEASKRPTPGKAIARPVAYPDCKNGSQRCQRQKGSANP